MPTRFKLEFESGPPDIDLLRFRQSLPHDFEVAQEQDGIYVTISSPESEDQNLQYLIDRELDRHFFLTAVKIRAAMVRRRVTASHELRYRIHGALNEGVGPQAWNYDLPVQLRLWSLADEARDHVVKIILFYQIIELARELQQQAGRYTDASQPPDPVVECRLVRNLAAHSGDVRDQQLRIYCEHLGLPALMHDPTDPAFVSILRAKVPLLEQEARNAIGRSL